MSGAEWITDRPPTEADGDMDGDVRMQLRPGDDSHHLVHWSYAGGAPWQHTSFRRPFAEARAEPAPIEPDRIAAMEQRVAELEATVGQLMSSNLRLIVEPRQ